MCCDRGFPAKRKTRLFFPPAFFRPQIDVGKSNSQILNKQTPVILLPKQVPGILTKEKRIKESWYGKISLNIPF